jgi:hypothetical protein
VDLRERRVHERRVVLLARERERRRERGARELRRRGSDPSYLRVRAAVRRRGSDRSCRWVSSGAEARMRPIVSLGQQRADNERRGGRNPRGGGVAGQARTSHTLEAS